MYVMYKTKISFGYHNEYDDRNNKIKTLYSDGCEETWAYNEDNKVSRHKFVEKDGEVTIDERYEYKDNTEIIYDLLNENTVTKIFDEESNNLLAVISSDSSKLGDICFTYDQNNNVLEEFNSKGIITSYKYDDKGNNIYKKTIVGVEEWSEYDEHGNVIRRKNSNGIEEKFKYDEFNRLVKYESSIKYNNREIMYDDQGRIKTIIYNGDVVEKYLYDKQGNLIQKKRPEYRIDYEYDDKNNLVEYKRIVED